MIDPKKFINQRMTKEDLSLLFLFGGDLEFKSPEQFENWLFILNFPLIAPYVHMKTRTPSAVRVGFDLPFNIVFAHVNESKFQYDILRDPSDDYYRSVLGSMTVSMYHPEARLLIKASRS